MMGFLQCVRRQYTINFALLVFLHLQNNKICSFADNTNSICKTEECRKLGTYYKNNMNEHVNPCENFYDYVCHGWGKHSGKPKFENIWALEQIMENNVVDKLQALLEKKGPPKREVDEVKAVYKACMDLPFFGTKNLAAIKTLMTKIGNWPMILPKTNVISLPWWQIDNQYTKATGESALIDFHLSTNPKNNNRIVMRLKNIDSPYGMLQRWHDWGSKSGRKDHYKAFLKKVIEAVAPEKYKNFQTSIDKDLDDVINFRESLRKVIGSTDKNRFQSSTIKNFQDWYDKFVNSKDTAKVDWLEKIRAMYKNAKDSYGSVIESSASIEIHKSYFEAFANFLGKHPKNVIVNHIHLYFVERYVPLAPSMEAELQQSIRDDVKPSGKIRREESRPHQCIENINPKTVLAKMYVASYFPKESKTEVNNLVETAQDMLMEQIIESTWLDNDMKGKSIAKMSFMQSAIGSSENVGERDIYDMDPLNLEAYYMTVNNRLYVPAAYLQTPIYTPNVPFPVDFGATVSVLGHEMYHGYDTDGITHDQYGKTPWWPKHVIAQYNTQTKCFLDQYNKKRMDEYKRHKLEWGPHVLSTLNEDIADVMGVKLAYRGFKQKLSESNGVCQLLPGFEKFSCEKLFFVAFGNTLCASLTPVGEQFILTADEHSLPRIRVNSAVSNMEEFAVAFNCSKQFPMNPQNRCDIWRK